MSRPRSRRRLLAAAFVTCTMVVACVGIEHLSTTSQLAVVASPGSANLGSAQIGQTTPPVTITISPASGSGDSTDTIDGFTTSCGPDFGIQPPVFPATVSRRCITGSGSVPTLKEGSVGKDPILAPGASGAELCQDVEVFTAEFSVVFRPSIQGTQSCQLFIQGTFGTLNVFLSGTGTLAPKVIDVQPPNIDFGDVRLPTVSRLVPIVIRNAGSSPLSISSVTVDDNVVFDVSGPSLVAHTLQPGASESFNVTCQPTSESSFSSNVRIVSDASNLPTALIPLACRGTDSALVPNPGSPVDLDTRVGEPIQRTIKVTNTGTASSTITAIQIVGTTDVAIMTAPVTPFAVAPTVGSFDVIVTYPAGTPQSKISAGKLRFTHDGEDQDVILSHSAVTTVLGANPDAVEFGPVCIGSSKSMPVKVFANAPGSFDVTAVGTPGNVMFSFTGALGTANGGHANELDYTARVTPTTLGATSDIVTLTTDIPGAPTRDFVLSVEALPAGVSANPAQVDYGTVEIGTVSLLKEVEITNCEDVPLDVTNAAVDGDASSDYTVVGPVPLARTLQPTESMQIQIIMNPQQGLGPGTRNAILVVTHSQGETRSDLIGTATGDEVAPPIEPPGPETYYQCSSSGSGGFLVGFAVLGLLIRRRRR